MNNVVYCLSTVALVCATAHALAQADKYPTKPVRMMLPFTAGTQTDVLARLIGQKLTESLGKQIVVDNRSGAGGMIAMQTVANSVPDGYTLFFDSSAFAIRPHLYPKAAINISRDFQAVSLVASSPHVLVVSSQLGPKTLKEFLDYARRKGDLLNWSHAGIGTSTHLVGEMFMREARLKNTGIPFRGAPEAMTEAIAMRASIFFAAVGQALPFILDGRVIGLAVTSTERSPVLPKVPTVAELGMPGFNYEVWFVIAAPGKTPKTVVNTLSTEVRRALGLADVKSTLETMGSIGRPTSPEEARAYVLKEYETLGKVIEIANIPSN
jgi:tripartite-type tricarboxylate transporter receptor subunit TctC